MSQTQRSFEKLRECFLDEVLLLYRIEGHCVSHDRGTEERTHKTELFAVCHKSTQDKKNL